jgi:hypothetical protein
VRANPLLQNVSGFRDLQQVASLELADLDALVTTAGLAALTAVERDLTVQGCPSLTELGFLPDVGWNLRIGDVPALETFAAPRMIDMAGGILEIWNTGLTHLEGLNGITQLESLNINGNQNLESLRGLSGLTALSNYLSITENSALPACEAEWLRDKIGESNIGGPIDLVDNNGSGSCAP